MSNINLLVLEDMHIIANADNPYQKGNYSALNDNPKNDKANVVKHSKRKLISHLHNAPPQVKTRVKQSSSITGQNIQQSKKIKLKKS